MRAVRKVLISLVLASACGPAMVVPGTDSGAPDSGSHDSGSHDSGFHDSGSPDAGPYEPPVVKLERSLFWTDPSLLDEVKFHKLMAIAAPDGHGGALLQQWFVRFSTTQHSERALQAQFLDAFAATHGADPTQWDLSLMPFKVTGIHNRIDLAQYGPNGHCGELRVSVSCTDVTLQPFHALFLFRQPMSASDEGCQGVARRWAELSRLEGSSLLDAVRAELRAGFVRERFELIETVEFSLAPWEWRQWVKTPSSGPLPFTLENPPLFQQVDVEGLNAAGPRRDEFLTWVADNAAALDARTLLLPERFRAQSVRVNQGVPRVPVSLQGLRADVAAQYPSLRQNLELVGCAACHTADAEFVQTRTDRTVSPFYDKELKARERHLEKLARGERPFAPFGPLQASPVLPP